MSGFEENEVSQRANGGTEITKRKLQAELPDDLLQHFQIVPSRVRELDEKRIRIYHAHDLAGDPECDFFKDSEKRNRFHKWVWSSNWQFQQFQMAYGIPYDRRSIVLDTWMDPVSESVRLTDKPQDVINLFYASTPQRGLALLVPVFEKLSEKHNDLHLHVHSSFSAYGWQDGDKQYEPLFDQIRKMPNATYHGFLPDRDDYLRRVNTYHVLAYPSIWQETSCRVLMEAMSAGCMCVHPNWGALPDTSGGLNWMYQGDITNAGLHASIFYQEMLAALDMFKTKREAVEMRLMFNKNYADTRFNFEFIKNKWETLLRQLVTEFPTEESREFPKEQFIYRV